MSWFRPLAVAPDLRDVLACCYEVAADGRHDLLPDGAMELAWVEGGDDVTLCGADTQSWSFDVAAGTAIVGARFRPGAARGVLGVDAAIVRDRRVGLADIVGQRRARVLTERLGDAADRTGRLAAMERFVRAELGGIDVTATGEATADLARLVAVDPAYGVDSLASTTGLSTRQLRRRFDRDVGYGPAFFARVARLQRFAAAAVTAPDAGLARLAVVAGYADQSHLAKDCRAIAGRTPREVVAMLPRSSFAVATTGGRSVQDGATADKPRSAA